MNKVKIVSKILFYITRILAFFYLGTAAYSTFCLLTGWGLGFRENKKYFHVMYPFTDTPFLNGDYNMPYIIFEFLLVLGLYGLFFLLASNIFKVFFQPKLFTEFGIRQLRYFYLANLLLPTLAVLFASIFAEVDDMAVILIILHFILGVFAYFFAAIFKQGLQLQKEQDLFI
ncbi:hypothetical protein [Emticicia fontis]